MPWNTNDAHINTRKIFQRARTIFLSYIPFSLLVFGHTSGVWRVYFQVEIRIYIVTFVFNMRNNFGVRLIRFVSLSSFGSNDDAVADDDVFVFCAHTMCALDCCASFVCFKGVHATSFTYIEYFMTSIFNVYLIQNENEIPLASSQTMFCRVKLRLLGCHCIRCFVRIVLITVSLSLSQSVFPN